LGERKVVEAVNGGDNSTNSKNTNSNKRTIHIHGGMEHNLVEYAQILFLWTQRNLKK